MTDINLADAKARFSELVEKVTAGESFRIIRRGKAVAILSSSHERQPVDVELMRKISEKVPFQDQSAGDFIRAMRDEDRY